MGIFYITNYWPVPTSKNQSAFQSCQSCWLCWIGSKVRSEAQHPLNGSMSCTLTRIKLNMRPSSTVLNQWAASSQEWSSSPSSMECLQPSNSGAGLPHHFNILYLVPLITASRLWETAGSYTESTLFSFDSFTTAPFSSLQCKFHSHVDWQMISWYRTKYSNNHDVMNKWVHNTDTITHRTTWRQIKHF